MTGSEHSSALTGRHGASTAILAGDGLQHRVNPNTATLRRRKTRKSASNVAAHRLGQVEAYLPVHEVLSEASTAADDVLSRKRSGFDRCRFAALGLTT